MTFTPSNPVLPSRDDAVVAAGSELVGGPAGRHVRAGRNWWTPVRVIVAMMILTFLLGVAQKGYCHANAWTRPGNAQYVHACYSDIPHLFRERGFNEGKLPYFDRSNDIGGMPYLEYPVVTGAVMQVAAVLARTSASDLNERAVRFYDITSVMLLLGAVIGVIAVIRLAGRRPWDGAMFALAPGLILTATINWDLIAVTFTLLGMLAWARCQPGLAGALIGLGAAAKFYPALLLIPLLVLCLRSGRLRELGEAFFGAILAWLTVNLPVMILAPQGWLTFYTFSFRRGEDFGSIWLILAQALGQGRLPWLNLLPAVSLLLLCLGIAFLGLSAPRRPRFPQLAFLVLAAFVLTNKVYSPQYVLWLIPLAVLARPRWRDFLIWQACEVVYFFGIWLYLAGADRGLKTGEYWLVIGVHLIGTAFFALMVVRDVLRPEHDPVRFDGTDDPAGGVFDRADDFFSLVKRNHANWIPATGARS
jgi:uncharacterized membrane protein